jgi:hypothetical protein
VVVPETAYIHCSWNVNNDQFCLMTDLRPLGQSVKPVGERGVWVGGGGLS